MDNEKIKKQLNEILKIALETSEKIPEKYQTDAFKIVLKNLLEKNLYLQTRDELPPADDDLEPIMKLARICNIGENELKNVLAFNGKTIELLCQIGGSDSHQLIVGSLVLLLSHEILLNAEWIKSSDILDSLKKIGIQDKGGNFSTYLKNKRDLFLKHANLSEYRLTTNNGRKVAAKIISKLSKNEQVEKEDLKT